MRTMIEKLSLGYVKEYKELDSLNRKLMVAELSRIGDGEGPLSPAWERTACRHARAFILTGGVS